MCIRDRHWSATNVHEEAKSMLEAMIEDEETNPVFGDGCRIIKLDSFTGEIHTNARKGKCKLTYDFSVNFKWSANPDGTLSEDDEFGGMVKFSEVFDHEPEGAVSVKTGKDKDGVAGVTRTIKQEGVERCVELIVLMLNSVTARHSKRLEMSLEQASVAAAENTTE
eukprot:TRINITY_DN2673_c0_g1_i7.p2 TRINITY_DN2673_c0_g1~~TRINITY_DN2673_c0_g1_i7.p2  ORF type:complete len:166 (+),score=64.52 TRINITY_DN2673_c0_g1_i7:141-638(+)